MARAWVVFRYGLRYVGSLVLLLGQSLACAVTPPFNAYRFLYQARRVGLGTFFISSVGAFFIGAIISLQMAYLMVSLSAEIYIPNVVAIALARELGPVMTAIIVAGRIGAGITAEIGTMTVTEQIDALKAFAVNPVRYLVVPRLLALLLMVPILTVFAVLAGILGGFVICHFKLSIQHHTYWNMVVTALVLKDVVTGLLKTFFFAAVIAIVGCWEGMNVRGGADGVGKATTLAVVRSFIFIILIDCVLTFIFYFVFNA
ncbi:MAG: ABC transporter permease [Elusimicrobia bacterium]|nr:ABC transporter permease [Elusimicrobiota bacterium]